MVDTWLNLDSGKFTPIIETGQLQIELWEPTVQIRREFELMGALSHAIVKAAHYNADQKGILRLALGGGGLRAEFPQRRDFASRSACSERLCAMRPCRGRITRRNPRRRCWRRGRV